MNIKRCCALAAAMVMVFGTGTSYCRNSSSFEVKAHAESIKEDDEKIGDNIEWSIDKDGTLTITGTGRMYDYVTFNESPLSENSSIKKVIIKDGIENVGGAVFWNCENLEKVVLPDSVTEIGDYAFYGCTALYDINLHSGITHIGYGVFDGTKWLENRTKQDPMVIFGNMLIDGSSCVGEVVVPEGVEKICDRAFYHNTEITSVILP
ncbi:MAG: leucine-rich repeat domain-containing protein, partial [Ruminococcus sp.]|nr:leucine-rich repeat domain-containing protein [Ruminococcus sp.]